MYDVLFLPLLYIPVQCFRDRKLQGVDVQTCLKFIHSFEVPILVQETLLQGILYNGDCMRLT